MTCDKQIYGKHVLDQLIMAHVFADYAMPMETVIVGDERGRFLYRSWDESRNVCGSAKYISEAVALVFARDSDKSSGTYFYVYLYRTILVCPIRTNKTVANMHTLCLQECLCNLRYNDFLSIDTQ